MRRVAVDECIANRLASALSEVYSHRGYDFTHISKLGGGKDEDWADVFKRFGGEIVLSGDVNIARRPHQQAAFLDAGLKCYFPSHPFQQLKTHQQAAYLVHNWYLIDQHLQSANSPGCWRMPTSFRDGALTVNNSAFKLMTVPSKVLDEMRKLRSAK